MTAGTELPRTARGHLHVEAFCLMWYACACGHRERIWNSRDGVTPFCTTCPSCGSSDLKHVNWREDHYLPTHTPRIGQRQWVAMTRVAAERIADMRIAAFALHGHAIPARHRPELIVSIFHGGDAPNLLVTGYSEE